MKTAFKKSTPLSFLSFLPVMLLSLLFFASACTPDEVDPNDPDATGQMEVWMTDSPAEFEALTVQIIRVEANVEGEGWITLSNEAQFHNVCELTNGKSVMIANSAAVKVNSVASLRITFGSDNSLTLAGLPISMDLAGSSTAEISVEIPVDVSLNASGATEVLLDFSVAESVVQSGTDFLFGPVMTWVEDTETGVRGEIEATATVTSNFFVTCTNGAVAFTAYANAEGQFMLRDVEEGTYELIIEAENALGWVDSLTVSGIVVVKGEMTTTGTIDF